MVETVDSSVICDLRSTSIAVGRFGGTGSIMAEAAVPSLICESAGEFIGASPTQLLQHLVLEAGQVVDGGRQEVVLVLHAGWGTHDLHEVSKLSGVPYPNGDHIDLFVTEH